MVNIMWRGPDSELDINEMMTQGARILKEVENQLPIYHTRQMRREFTSKFKKVGVDIPPHVVRNIYSELTGDATSDQNPSIDERVRQAIIGDDVDLVIDLRHLNKGRPDDTFNIFFSALEKIVEDIAAADERRHGVAHMSQFLSVRDLIEQVSADLPAETPIPSESTVLFAFVPNNAYRASAKFYKSKINLKFKIQTRQLRNSHPDEYYAAAQFKYARQLAVKLRDICTFLSIDDKAKVDYGEPKSIIIIHTM